MPIHRTTLFLLLGLPVIAACTSSTPDFQSPPKIFRVGSEFGGYVRIQGYWRETAQTSELKKLGRHNALSLRCEKATQMCDETVAVLYEPWGVVSEHSLGVVELSYNITEWSEEIIRAEYNAISGVFEIRISLVDQSAERSFRETAAGGNQSADPDVLAHWVLDGNE